MPRLVVHEPGGVTSGVAVEEEIAIGRDEGMGLVLGDAKVSRHHATIRREGGEWVVSDAESRHGTFVNGERVTRRVLRDGDQLQIGSTRMAFEQVEDRSGVALHLAAGEQTTERDDVLRHFHQPAIHGAEREMKIAVATQELSLEIWRLDGL